MPLFFSKSDKISKKKSIPLLLFLFSLSAKGLASPDAIEEFTKFCAQPKYQKIFLTPEDSAVFSQRLKKKWKESVPLTDQMNRVMCTYEIMQANGDKDFKVAIFYELAEAEHERLNTFLEKESFKKCIEHEPGDGIFQKALSYLGKKIKLNQYGGVLFSRERDLTITTALDWVEFQEKTKETIDTLSAFFKEKKKQSQSVLKMIHPVGSEDPEKIDAFFQKFATEQPTNIITLNPVNLTRNDVFSAALRSFSLIGHAEYQDMRREQSEEAQKCIDCIWQHSQTHPNSYFIERFYRLWTEIPGEKITSTDVFRPGDQSFDSDTWKRLLRPHQKEFSLELWGIPSLSLENIDWHLHKLEHQYQNILKDPVLINDTWAFCIPIAKLIQKEKESLLNILSSQGDPLYSEKLLQLAKQRLCGPLSLVVSQASFTKPEEFSRVPIHFTDPEKVISIFLSQMISLKKLVEKVYDEFDQSIFWWHLRPVVSGSLEMRRDLHAIKETGSGIFFKYGTKQDDFGKKPLKELFTKGSAFYLLEKMGYVSIDPEIKEKLYSWDRKQIGKVKECSLNDYITR